MKRPVKWDIKNKQCNRWYLSIPSWFIHFLNITGEVPWMNESLYSVYKHSGIKRVCINRNCYWSATWSVVQVMRLRLQQTACINCSGCWRKIGNLGGGGGSVWMWRSGWEQEMPDASNQNKNIYSSLKKMLDNWCTRKRFDCNNTFTMKNMKHFSTECSKKKKKALFSLKFSIICPIVHLIRVVLLWAFMGLKTLIKKYSEKSSSSYQFGNHKPHKAGLGWNLRLKTKINLYYI
jgi:hypothetical protein